MAFMKTNKAISVNKIDQETWDRVREGSNIESFDDVSKSTFKCASCGVSFETQKDLEDHQKNHQSKVN